MSTPDLLLQWSIAAAIALVLALRRKLTLLHAPTWYLGFHVLAYCLRPTLLHVLGIDGAWSHLGLRDDPEGLRHALWVSSAALAVFTTAYLAVTWRAEAVRPAIPVALDASERRALAITWALLAPPVALVFLVIRDTAAPAAVLFDFPGVLLAPAALLILAARWRWWSFMPLAVWIWARWEQLTPDARVGLILTSAAWIVVLALWTLGRPWPSVLVLVTATAGVAVAFATDWATLGARWTSELETPPIAAGEPIWKKRLQHPSLAYTESLTAVRRLVPARTGEFSHGAQHLAWLLDAGGAAPTQAGTTRGLLRRHGKFNRMPLPLVAEGWVSGGWLGVGITAALAGLLLGGVFLAFSRRQDDPGAAVLLALALAWALPWFTHGGEAILRMLPLAVASLALWKILAGRLRRGAEAALERERLREDRHRRRLLGTALLNPHAGELPPGALEGDPRSGGNPPERPAASHAPPRWRAPPPS